VTYLTRLSKGFGTTLWAKLHYRRQKKTEEGDRRREEKSGSYHPDLDVGMKEICNEHVQ